jgi:type I restriction enzyme M protein
MFPGMSPVQVEANQLGANFASSEYFVPMTGLIFLRHTFSRFLLAKTEIELTLPKRGGQTGALTKEDFSGPALMK